jgi:myo-inositol-1(or 4)-monophosphatase
MKNWLQLATRAAREAGNLLSTSGSGKVTHVDRDIKLEADGRAERVILDMLGMESAFAILAEETGFRSGVDASDPLCWIVDPLDGSSNFERHIPLCCVSVALWRGLEPVLGVIYDFNRDELFSAIVGQGAELNGEKIQVSVTAEASRATLCTGYPVSTDFSPAALNEAISEVRRYKKIRMLGSAALSLAYVAAGRADVYREKDIRWWDVAAGLALVRAAGGSFQMHASQVEHAFHVHASNGHLPLI